MDPKTICFDLDGTLCSNTFGEYEQAVPFPWAIERVNALAAAGHLIKILTARGFASGIDWEPTTRAQLERWGVAYDELHFGKPNADVYVDDRAVHTDAWRVSDVARPPGFWRDADVVAGEEIPARAPADRSTIVEVARTFGGGTVALARHAERSRTVALHAGIRAVAGIVTIESAVAEAVARAGTAEPDDDVVIAIAHVDATHLSLVDTWRPEPTDGLHVSCRRLSQAAAGLLPFVADADAGADGVTLSASLSGGRGEWPLLESPSGVLDGLGGILGVILDGRIRLATGAGPPLVEQDTVQALAREAAIEVDTGAITRAQVERADEAFVIGPPFCLLELGGVDGRRPPHSGPGSLARTLLAGWSASVGVDITAQTALLLERHRSRLRALGVT